MRLIGADRKEECWELYGFLRPQLTVYYSDIPRSLLEIVETIGQYFDVLDQPEKNVPAALNFARFGAWDGVKILCMPLSLRRMWNNLDLYSKQWSRSSMSSPSKSHFLACTVSGFTFDRAPQRKRD